MSEYSVSKKNILQNLSKKILCSKIAMKLFIVVLVFSLLSSYTTFADWVNDGVGYKYVNSATNQYVVNNWIQTGNGYYFLDHNGYIVKGWYLINGKYFYFSSDGIMQTGFQEINEKKYYLDTATGEMVTGWVQTFTDGVVEYYYFDESGAMCTGWKQIDNKWYYFNDGKAVIGTWAKINDIWYHLNNSGYMDTGWVNTNGKMYHLNVTNGSLTRGWIQDQYGNEYYLSEVDGSLTVNCTLNINGVVCTFDELGKCIAKNQYNGNTNAGVIGTNGEISNANNYGVYGVNVGISPGQNLIDGAVTSSQVQAKTQSQNSLEAGSTAGPQ